jgi:hypothetical protein
MFASRASLAGFVGLTTAGIVLTTFAACVDSNAPKQGELNGPCFNGNCNVGLVCSNATGSPICVKPDATDASPNDAASDADAGPRQCTFQPTTFPCSGGPACYGASQGCSLTGCPGGDTDYKWDCFGPNQCGNTPCCIAGDAAALTPTADCSQGGLKMAFVDGGAFGGIPASTCGTGLACATGDIQLCQFNSQCQKGTVCSPVKISGSGASASNVIIGACVPE